MKRPRYVYPKPNGLDLFFKHPKTGKLPIPRLGAPDFNAEYHRLLSSVANGTLSLPVKAKSRKHIDYGGEASVGALAKAYFASTDFAKLSTKHGTRQRAHIEQALQTIHPTPMENDECVSFAEWRIDEVNPEVARDLRDAIKHEPRPDDRPLRRSGDLAHWRDVRTWSLRVMFNWGVDRPYRWHERDASGRLLGRRTMTGNPFTRVPNLYVAGDGFRTLSDDDCDALEAYLIGERLPVDRLAFGLCRYAAVRRCDVIRLGAQHVKTLRDRKGKAVRCLVFKEWKGSTSNTAARTNKQRVIPIVAQLWELIERADGMSRSTFIVGPRGGSCDEDHYGTRFNDLCRKAGLPEGCTMHGIRKYVGTRMAEGGATPHQIAAMLGHQDRKGGVSIKNVLHYTAKADNRKLTDDALDFVVDRG